MGWPLDSSPPEGLKTHLLLRYRSCPPSLFCRHDDCCIICRPWPSGTHCSASYMKSSLQEKQSWTSNTWRLHHTKTHAKIATQKDACKNCNTQRPIQNLSNVFLGHANYKFDQKLDITGNASLWHANSKYDRNTRIMGSVSLWHANSKYDRNTRIMGSVSLLQASHKFDQYLHIIGSVFGTGKLYKFDQYLHIYKFDHYLHIIGSVSLGQASYINLITTCTSLGVCLWDRQVI